MVNVALGHYSPSAYHLFVFKRKAGKQYPVYRIRGGKCIGIDFDQCRIYCHRTQQQQGFKPFWEICGFGKNQRVFLGEPFFTKKTISLRAVNFDTETLKVNDKLGNPIMIGAVVVWRVSDTFKAAFEVDSYSDFVHTQSEAAIRKMAGAFAYDNMEDETAEITLRSSSAEVSEMLEQEISERLSMAGITVIEARISHLAYATEIASAMLQRQQATAIIAARSKIVEGAVGMVEMALDMLGQRGVVTLDEEKKAAMVSNLLVVLCGERAPSPVVNAGTLHT
jgi:regulator of protease activity HflC (stomatin/prohibitin superfamily)